MTTVFCFDRPLILLKALMAFFTLLDCEFTLPGSVLMSGSSDKTVRLWKDGRLVSILEGHNRRIACMAVLPGGILASGSSDKTVRLWNRDGRLVKTLREHTDQVMCLAVLPGGQLASGSKDTTVRLWG